MIYIQDIRVLGSVTEAMDVLPVLKKYDGLPAREKLPVVFLLYAKYRNANVFFDDNGLVSGYSEPSIEKDPVLKELHILSMGTLMDAGVKKDMMDLWDGMREVCFGCDNRDLPRILCTYLVTGPSVYNNVQSSKTINKDVAGLMESLHARKIYELTGDIDLFGDGYSDWKEYTACFPDERTRFLDELARSLNGNSHVRYVQEDLMAIGGKAFDRFDTVLANLSVHGGRCSDGDRYEVLGNFFDNLLEYWSHHPYIGLKCAIVALDPIFLESIQYKWVREKLLYLKVVENVTLVVEENVTIALLVLRFPQREGNVKFRKVVVINGEETTNNVVDSFDYPDSVLFHNECNLHPDSYLDPGENDMGNVEYQVALVGSPLMGKEKRELENNRIFVSCETETLTGDKGLFQMLKEDASRPLRTIQAVIMDGMTQFDRNAPAPYVGIVELIVKPECDVPVFIYANYSQDDLGALLNQLIDKLRDRVFFVMGKSTEALRTLISKVRNTLDAMPTDDADVMSKYRDEISSANVLDSSGKMARMLARILKQDVHFDPKARDTEEMLNSLRTCAETIIMKNGIEKYGFFPPLGTLGEVIQFLQDGEYYDKFKKVLYVLEPMDLMPEALRESMGWFVTMTNGASHDALGKNIDVRGYMYSSGRAGVFRACTFILLDLLGWFMPLCSRGGHYFSNQPAQRLMGPADTVRMVRNRDYYYIGKVHLLFKPGLTEGIPSERIRLNALSFDKYPVNKDVSVVRYYAKPDDYDILP